MAGELPSSFCKNPCLYPLRVLQMFWREEAGNGSLGLAGIDHLPQKAVIVPNGRSGTSG